MGERSRQLTRRHQWNTQRELSAPAPSSSPWQRKLSQLPPVYYSPPPSGGNGRSREACCKCVCHSAGGGGGGGVIDVGVKESRHSSSTTTNSSSQSPSPWLPAENPVALSRDAYLKASILLKVLLDQLNHSEKRFDKIKKGRKDGSRNQSESVHFI